MYSVPEPRDCSFLFVLPIAAHPVLDVVVDDKIQLLVRKPVVRRQHQLDFVTRPERNFSTPIKQK
jgi:hypothetical protein